MGLHLDGHRHVSGKLARGTTSGVGHVVVELAVIPSRSVGLRAHDAQLDELGPLQDLDDEVIPRLDELNELISAHETELAPIIKRRRQIRQEAKAQPINKRLWVCAIQILCAWKMTVGDVSRKDCSFIAIPILECTLAWAHVAEVSRVNDPVKTPHHHTNASSDKCIMSGDFKQCCIDSGCCNNA